MPTDNRTAFIKVKARAAFRLHLKEADPSKREELMMLAHAQLDNVLAQASHLQSLAARGVLKN
eukprot:CAMPEP_0119104188 /NCGR_PEP_ID=MMETSP1180-20130426/2462_1 /TAXON_ID=3052 ORGANISM="Chlamydomonas cf sp, Strain CCMP681" /NCGR_SAMPLE_ID=MMETSP1180 /ASSEMBLY_ACC=CAM_ASM_000741 /LENGTH=62 /DNA_ID=CAMNT_0007088873 /DNA_START=156 /DNA_END=344 /DNA_ORIENTATION=+